MTALIVPMNVCALVIGGDGGPDPTGFARIGYDFDQLASQPYIGESVGPAPFETASGDHVLPPGVHLHWALPAALARGTTDAASDALAFQTPPNRWLVARLGPAGAAAQAWVVESDRLGTDRDDHNARSRPVPLDTSASQVVALLGRATPLSEWAEDTSATFIDNHTAVGFGVAGFAGAYPHAPNVFGMWDPLNDRGAAESVTYLVAGWHSDEKQDPLPKLSATTGLKPAAALAAATGWTVTGDDVPARMICAGAVTGVPADPSAPRAARTPAAVEVAVGHTGIEALSALLAARDGGADAPQLELALNLLQEGLLARLGKPDGLAACDDRLHTQRFAAIPGGTQWTLERTTPATDGTKGPVTVGTADLTAAAAGTGAPVPQDLADSLDALNAAQREADAEQRAADAARSQLFADWCKYMEIAHGTPPSDAPTADDARHFVGAAAQAVGDLAETAKKKATAVDDQAKGLQTTAGAAWRLVAGAAPRFWQPAEPVVVLSGDDVVRPDRYGRGTQTKLPFTLPVRTSAQLIGELEIADPAVTVGAADLQSLDLGATPLATELGALVAETALLDPGSLAALEGIAAAKPGGAAGGDLAKAVAAAQADARAVGPPALALEPWSQPWIPLLLDWQVEFTPDPGADTRAGPYGTKLLTDLELDPATRELVAPAAGAGRPEVFVGTAHLASSATLPLAKLIDDHLDVASDDPAADELRAVRADLGSGILAQSLSGLGAAFLMRRQTLQLPVRDPLARGLLATFTSRQVAPAVGGATDLAGLPMPILTALRAGRMTIRALRIVDAFGQVRELDHPSCIRAASARAPGDSQDASVWLPPRLQQGARLNFRWLSAEDDDLESGHPASSPICGWLLYNRLDGSLAIYDAGGVPLGSLHRRAPVWRVAPDATTSIDQAGVNAHLQRFVNQVANRPDGPDFVGDLLDAIDDTLTNVAPGTAIGAGTTGALVARPLALVRAQLDLELLGPPALDQSWTAFGGAVSAAVAGAGADARTDGGIASVQVPVRLGDLSASDDGLVAYFTDDTYATALAAAGTDRGHGVRPPNNDELTVCADRAVAPKVVTMIADPTAGVYAATGVLPRKRIAIPPAMYAPALRALAVTFAVMPALSRRRPQAAGRDRVAVPAPSEPGFDWRWLTLTGAGNVDKADLDGAPATLAGTAYELADGWLALSSRSANGQGAEPR